MKKLVIMAGIVSCAVLLSGCKEKGEAFVGHWKAVSTASGNKVRDDDSLLTIECKDNTCHVKDVDNSLGEPMVSEHDWDIKNDSTLSVMNGLESMYIKDGKIHASNRIYEKQKE